MLDHFKSSRKVQTNDLCQCFALCFRSTHQLWSVQPSLCKTHPVFWTLWEPQTVRSVKNKKKHHRAKVPAKIENLEPLAGKEIKLRWIF